MRPELLEEALGYVSNKYIQESATVKKRPVKRLSRTFGWAGAAAAVLVLAMLLPAGFDKVGNTEQAPAAEAPAEMKSETDMSAADKEAVYGDISTPYLLSSASAPRIMPVPNYEDYQDREDYNQAVDLWGSARTARWTVLDQTLENLTDFFREGNRIFLDSPKNENRVYSPVNSYIALAMLAEVTGGNSRQQILDVLDTPDLDTLRTQVSAVWESAYREDESGTSILANSLWLDEDIAYRQEATEALAYHHYASSYQGDLGSEEMNEVLRQWLNESTGGLLEDSVDGVELSPDSILALASTVYLRSYWSEQFNPDFNTEEVFHSKNGDITHTFMHQREIYTYFYEYDSFTAICKGMMNGSGMWLILPKEGVKMTDLLEDAQYMELLNDTAGHDNPNARPAAVNLSLPRFDVDSSADLKEGLMAMGITDVFGALSADFSSGLDTDIPVWVGSVEQAARVAIDEEGAEAASYTLIVAPGSAEPTQREVIDFVLDRPFLFIIEISNLPLFAGVVNEP